MIDIATHFKDKNVILVGNSVEIMHHEYADFIDSHDIVVRFGKAINADETEQKSIGKKIDVWAVGSWRSNIVEKNEHLYERVKNAAILFNRSRIHLTSKITKTPRIANSVDMYSDEEITEVHNKLNIKDGDKDAHRLSIGLWTTMFFCDKVKNYKSLTLIGFDFFAKETTVTRAKGLSDDRPTSWHLPISGTSRVHNHEQESSIVKKYQEQGLLNWMIISDLKPAICDNSKYGKF